MIQVNRIYLIFNRLVTKKFLVDTSDDKEKNGSYRELLFDERWLKKRAHIIQRDNFRCVICGSTTKLIVHHKQYHKNAQSNQKCLPWDYDDKYLVTLCESCHCRGHQKYQIPMKIINQ